MNKLYLGLLIELIGTIGIFTFPLMYVMTLKFKYIILAIITFLLLIIGYTITLS